VKVHEDAKEIVLRSGLKFVDEKNQTSRAGWIIRQSIVLELDSALTFVGRGLFHDVVRQEIAEMLTNIPAEWQEQWPQMVGVQLDVVSLLEYAAQMAGVLLESNYERATLAIRELTLADALKALEQLALNYQLVAQPDLPLPERVIDLAARFYEAGYANLGFKLIDTRFNELRKEIAQVVRILRDGDLHTRFWFWLDRFYFEVYTPWRRTRGDVLERLQQHVLTALGTAEHYGTPPDLSWLPAQNPALRLGELREAIEDGKLLVCFWIEPFGLVDSNVITTGMVVLSISEPGPWFEEFLTFTDELARRTHALGDPTRLLILRLIRHYGMVNTEIANYLQLARPTVSIHAKILREAGLIQSHQEGRLTRHEIVPSEVRRLFRDLERFLDLPPQEEA
jgi:DNA-binding transcriptional ArsR family regulator